MSNRILRSAFSALLAVAVLSACASSADLPLDTAPRSVDGTSTSRISACKSTDTQIDSSNQCLQDDAACYPLSNGKWCTGERGNTCPAGSVALPAGQPCPVGKRCFRVGESLECTIN